MTIDPEYERLLRGRGATDAEIETAARGGQHYLNALNTELTVTPRGDMTVDDVARASGAVVEDVARWWQALGLPDPRRAGSSMGEADVAMVKTCAALAAFVPENIADDLLRVFSASTRQVANAGVNALRAGFEQPLRRAGTSDAEVSQAYDVVVAVLPDIAAMFDTLMRRYIVESVYEQVAVNEDGAVETLQTIVFADLVDYTGLAQRLGPAQLGDTLSGFESAAAAIASQHGGRLVKLLGDGVMLSFGGRDDGVAAACALVADASVPPCRAGVATGPVLTRQGDFYGTVVNLAARLSGVIGGGEVAVHASAPVDGATLDAPVALKGIAEPVAFYRLNVGG